MRFRTHLFIVFMFLLTVCSYAGTIPTYDVTQVWGKDFICNFWAMNNLQQAAGVHYIYEQGKGERSEIFIWDNGTIIDVNMNIDLGERFYPNDINDHCQIVGRYDQSKGFFWDKGQTTLLGSLGGSTCLPVSINNKGQVVGYSTTADEKNQAFLWENGVMKALVSPSEYYCSACDINNNGQIVGFSVIKPEESEKAFLYENGEMHDLGINGRALSINDAGQIVGFYRIGGREKPFILENGKLTDIEMDQDNSIMQMYINNKGQVAMVDYQSNSYIWTKESGTVSLKSLIPNAPNANGYYLISGISDNGVIAGVFGTIFTPSTHQAVIPPLFSYKPSMYNKPIQVKITSPTENAVIHYTTNGADPTGTDPTIESGGTVLIDKDTVLKAKAWRSDCMPSGVREREYKIRQKTWKGLVLVSIPTTPSNSDPKLAVGFSNNYWYTYNTTAKVYAGYPDQYTWFDISKDNSIRAFWAKFNTVTPIPEGNYRTEGGIYSIDLKPGWNMIGQPYVSAHKWDTSAISVFSTGPSSKLKDAGSVVYPYLWGWKQSVVNPNTGAYYRVGDPSVYPDAVDIVEPFEGYWIKAKKECRLQIPIPVDNQ